ncbi:hypothetical protein PENTCL1PPCAC_26880, partial [Pristionchus entomophagus]
KKEEEERRKKEEDDRVKKDEEEKEKKRIEEERRKEEEMKKEEEKKRKIAEEEERLRKENKEKECMREVRQAFEDNGIEAEDASSVMSDERSIGDSEGSIGLTPKQLAERKRKMRDKEVRNERLAREFQAKLNRDEEEKHRIEKRRDSEDSNMEPDVDGRDTAEREALNALQEEEARLMRETNRQKRLEKKQQREKEQKTAGNMEGDEADKVTDAAIRKKSTTSTGSSDEPKKKKRGRPRKNISQIDEDKKHAEAIQKKRKMIIESSSDEQIPVPSTSAATAAASPISDRSNSTYDTPSPPTDASSSTANPGVTSSSAARGGEGIPQSTPLPPSSPPKSSTIAGQKNRSSDSSEMDPNKSKLGGMDYVGRDAMKTMEDMPRIPKKKHDEQPKKHPRTNVLPSQPQRQIELHHTSFVPLVHPPSANPKANMTPWRMERDKVAGRIEKSTGNGRRSSDDSTERRPTVKQPRDKMKNPVIVREDPLDKIDMGDKRKLSNAETALQVKQARIEEGIKGGSFNGQTPARMYTPSGRSPAYVQSPVWSPSADSPHYGSPQGDGTRPRPIQQIQHVQQPPPHPPPPLPL